MTSFCVRGAVAAGVASLVFAFTLACAAREPCVRAASGAANAAVPASASATDRAGANLGHSAGSNGAVNAPLGCNPPGCANEVLPAYEPEVADSPAEMTSAEAEKWVRALEAPPAPACAKWRKPLAHSCDDAASEVVTEDEAKVFRLGHARSLAERQAQSEALFRREGCTAFPKGAVRWWRIRALEGCGVELAAPALASGGPELDPTVRGLLVGEVIAEQCRRGVEPMPPYRGLYAPERFRSWRQQAQTPWQARTRKRLAACHDVAASLPSGGPGRAAALMGYAQAVAKFVTAHRTAPISKALQQNYEQRMAYYVALDEVMAALSALRDAANDEARREVTRDGDYDAYAGAFAAISARQEPLNVLGLPSLSLARGPQSETAAEQALALLPLRLSAPRFARPTTWKSSSAERVLLAMLRRGLPQQVRAQVGAQLAGLSVVAPTRQRLHGLLAAGLLRLGLVTQDREVVARAAYELRYADVSATTTWLSAITRALLTPGAAASVFAKFTPPGHAQLATPLDVSGFTPQLLALADSANEYAAIAVDHAILASSAETAERYFEFARRAVERARRPGVPPALTACVNEWALVCRSWGYFERIGGPSCDCTPFPWRVQE